MLETERATRGTRRVFVPYEDLLRDWRGQLARVGETLDLPLIKEIRQDRAAAIDEFVDPTLQRSRGGWEGHEVPASVRELADRVWGQLELLADPAADAPAVGAELDVARTDYVELYGEAEAIAQSSVTAVKPRKRKKAQQPAQPAGRLTALKVKVARRLPPRYRKRLRSAIRAFGRS
jgi:hypothetical protein